MPKFCIYSSYVSVLLNFLCYFQAFGVFGLCQIIAFTKWLRARMSEWNFQFLFRSTILFAACAIAMSVIVASYLGSKCLRRIFFEIVVRIFRLSVFSLQMQIYNAALTFLTY